MVVSVPIKGWGRPLRNADHRRWRRSGCMGEAPACATQTRGRTGALQPGFRKHALFQRPGLSGRLPPAGAFLLGITTHCRVARDAHDREEGSNRAGPLVADHRGAGQRRINRVQRQQSLHPLTDVLFIHLSKQPGLPAGAAQQPLVGGSGLAAGVQGRLPWDSPVAGTQAPGLRRAAGGASEGGAVRVRRLRSRCT